MTTVRINSADGVSSDDGSTWALAKDKLSSFDTADAAGDIALVASTHSETSTGAHLAHTFAGTLAAPTKIYSVSPASENPTVITPGATVATTGAYDIRMAGHLHAIGVTFLAGDSANFASLSLNNAIGATGAKQTYEDCDLTLRNTHPSAIIHIGGATSTNGSHVVLIKSRLKTANASQAIHLNGTVRGAGISFAAGTSTPTLGVFHAGGGSSSCIANLRDSDFSQLSASANLLVLPTVGKNGVVRFFGGKLPASWSGNLFAGASLSASMRGELFNFVSGSTKIIQRVEDGYGSANDSQAVYRTGGASIDGTPFSIKLTGSASASFPIGGIDNAPIARHYPGDSVEDAAWVAGASKTVSVELMQDVGVSSGQGSGTGNSFQNIDVVAELTFYDTAGTQVGETVTSAPSPLAAPSDLASSSEAWTTTGLTTPMARKISFTVTPEVKGVMLIKITFYKTGKSAYACGKVTVT